MVHGIFVGMLLLAAASDLARFRIPNVLSAGLALLFIAVALPRFGEIGWSSHVAAGALTLGGGFLLFLLRAIGAGDVKLFAASSLWLGLDLVPAHLVCTALLGLVLLGALLVGRGLASRIWPGTDGPPDRPQPPRVLRRGMAVPYGVAIAGSAALLSGRVPEPLWWF